MYHRLSNMDAENQIADCSACGPGQPIIQYQGSKGRFYPRCLTAARKSSRNKNRQLRYGVGPDDYGLLLSVQDGCCAICKATYREDAPLHVDHCHETGRVRGLLCFSCNSILGNARDSRDILQAAMDYLEIYSTAPLTV